MRNNVKDREEIIKRRLVVALIALVISFVVSTSAQQNETVGPQILQQYEELRKKFDEAMNNNNASALAACFTKDAVLVTNRGQTGCY